MKPFFSKLLYLSFIFFILINTAHAFEYELNSVVKHPTRKELYVSGEFKIMFVIDNEKGTILKSVPVPFDVKKMTVSKSGKIIATSGTQLYIYNPETNTGNSVSGTGDIYTVNNSDYYFDISNYYKKGVKIYSVEDQQLYAEFPLTESLAMYSYSPQTNFLYLFSSEIQLADEKSLITKTVEKPSGYNVYSNDYVAQQSDGKGQNFMIYDLNKRSITVTKQLPYKMSSSFSKTIAPVGEDLYVLYWSGLIKIEKNGKCTPIELADATFNYASAATLKGHLICSSMKDGYIYNTASGTSSKFDVSSGYSDKAYTKDIFIDGDNIYVLAEDYTIYTMDASGVKKSMIDFSQNGNSGIKYSVMYYNGYSQKDKQDLEAEGLNSVLKAKKLPAISLEGKSGYIEVATFNTITEAKAFLTDIKGKVSYTAKILPKGTN